MRDFDIVVIGAGPAGMAAAVEAAAHRLEVLVLDENQAPGGQIYRNIEAQAAEKKKTWKLLGQSYREGADLAVAFRSADIEYVDGAMVWQIDADGTLAYSKNGAATTVRARRVIAATGAMERAVPIAGWTLPGVMGAGAAQNMLKSASAVPDGRIVLAGCGPLLLLVAQQLAEAGADVAAVLETTSRKDYIAALPYLPRALYAAVDLQRGIAMRRYLRGRGFPVISGVTDLAAEGEQRISEVRYKSGNGEGAIKADMLLLHQGVVPNVQLTRLLRCDHEWLGSQRYWRPVLDEWGATSVPVLAVAGDGGGIFGAKAAALAGRLAALDAASKAGVFDINERNRRAARLRSQRNRLNAIRPFLDRLFAPPAWSIVPSGADTIVCRCEEVTAGEIRQSVALGAMGPNQMKAFLRCGMGPCQGRFCGLSVVETIAAARGIRPEESNYYRIRPPIKPVTLGELATLGD